ncbi:hypothetical protein EQP59_04160 [Ornithobacterium rhinotracheale]|uniref:Uncharacterized protein n=1 Tax=Ornithobacterium rhinotracheale TaxID=28251 RepID=A0A410JR22_ORNRH|nr:hypothetical protein [Ornithobacterium rhinotracheale]QAR30600.1 hypothetical protein EQP59_04160 [Ornithobacterium rhinotracheale]
MKKFSTLIFIMFFAMPHAQKSIDVQARFLENTKYEATTKYEVSMQMPDREEFLDMNFAFKMDFLTGKKSGNKTPIVIKMKKMDFKINENLIPISFNDLKMYGAVENRSKISIDSISGTMMNREVKNQLKKTFDQMKQYDFSGKIKVGESKTLSIPINMDGDEVVAKMVYTLERIENDHGIFNFKGEIPEYISQQGLKTSIDLEGKLFYDIKNFFYDRNNINMKMKMTKGSKIINALGEFSIRINIVKE